MLSFPAYVIVDSYFRCGTLVSADSSGAVQFWDSQHGTLLQAHTSHKGDVNALAAAPSHNRVFSAGSDGQVQIFLMFAIIFLLCHCQLSDKNNKFSP